MEDLTSFQRDCLYVLHDLGESKGSEIQAELESYYDQHIHAARLYPSLDDLANQDLIEKGSRGPRTNYYVLAPAGKDALLEIHIWKIQKYPDEIIEAGS